MIMWDEDRASSAFETELWVVELREQLVEDGYERNRVDGLIAATLVRFRSARLPDFVPLLVERHVLRTLREEVTEFPQSDRS